MTRDKNRQDERVLLRMLMPQHTVLLPTILPTYLVNGFCFIL